MLGLKETERTEQKGTSRKKKKEVKVGSCGQTF